MSLDPTTDFAERPSAPALTMIGYVRAIFTNDGEITDAIEDAFDSTYLAAGSLQVAVSIGTNFTSDPATLYEMVLDGTTRFPIRARSRAMRDFLENLIDSLDEYEFLESIAGEESVDGPTFDHRDLINAYEKKALTRGMGAAIAEITLAAAYLTGSTEEQVLAKIYTAYIDHEAGR